MPTLPPVLRLDAAGISLVLDLRRGRPELAWIGAPLPPDADLIALCDALHRGAHESQPDDPVPRSLLPLGIDGEGGTPVLSLIAGGHALHPRLALLSASVDDGELRLDLADAALGITLALRWRLMPGGLVAVSLRLGNTGKQPLTVLTLASLALPVPARLTHMLRYGGRWAAEMRAERLPIPHGELGARSRGGRPGFGGGNWVLLEEAHATETSGLVLGAHLAWSGDHWQRIERDAEGDTMLLMGAEVDAGELRLAPGESFETPELIFGLSSAGRAGLRQAFHAHVRNGVLPGTAARPRRVHLNTWEALGFDLDPARLVQLVEDAATLGVERFVLDDGWFRGRRNDCTSLGDWQPDPQLFPEGLGPLIACVHDAGMDFGLWVEPEMISPDSALYRNHPDWCLHTPEAPRLTQRHQLVLDLTRPEVSDYLFEALDKLLRENAIAYLKWDHNRELFPRAGRGLAQVQALYALLARLRAAHPGVEIETCASGGGRVDLGILQHCTRFWASDNNDPLERLRINRGWWQFLPLCATGNHVGPSPNPVTGRRIAMDFRAKVALFGHMGVEADPARMSAEERECLAAHIALYKAWRERLHDARLFELVCETTGVQGWLALDAEGGLALATQRTLADDYNAAPLRFPGLDPAARYRLRLPEPWPAKAAHYLAMPARWREGLVLDGRVLTERGIALPLVHPETAWLISLERLL